MRRITLITAVAVVGGMMTAGAVSAETGPNADGAGQPDAADGPRFSGIDGPSTQRSETEQPAFPDAEAEQDRSRDGTGECGGSEGGGETSDEPRGTSPGTGNGGLGEPGGPDRP